MKYLVAVLLLLAMCIPAMAVQASGQLYPYCGDTNIFFRNDSSDISGYKILDHIPQLADTQTISKGVSKATSPQTLATFITPNNSPNVTTLAPGLWRFRTYLYTSSVSGTTTFQYLPFVRYANGSESDIFYGHIITTDVNALVGSPTEYLNSYARRNYTTFAPGSRLGIRINVSTTDTNARTTYITTAGNTQASMVSVGYFICPQLADVDTDIDLNDTDVSVSPSQSGSGGEALALAFGLAGGMIGAIVIVRRSDK